MAHPTLLEPMSMNQMGNVLMYIRLRAEGKIPVNPRIEDYLAGRPLRDDDGVFMPPQPSATPAQPRDTKSRKR